MISLQKYFLMETNSKYLSNIFYSKILQDFCMFSLSYITSMQHADTDTCLTSSFYVLLFAMRLIATLIAIQHVVAMLSHSPFV